MFKSEGKKKIDTISCHLWQAESSLLGLAALLQNQGGSDLSSDELFGIGQIIKRYVKELSEINEMIGDIFGSSECEYDQDQKEA